MEVREVWRVTFVDHGKSLDVILTVSGDHEENSLCVLLPGAKETDIMTWGNRLN